MVPALDLRNDVERLVNHVVELPADKVLNGGSGAAIRDQGRLKAEFRIEHEARHMRDRADAGVAVTQFRMIGLEEMDELFEAPGRGVLFGHDCLRSEIDDADLVFEVRIERRRSRLGSHIPNGDRVAARLRLGSARHPQGTAGTADVLHNDRLSQRARHVFADKAGDDVGRSAGGERHDDGNRFTRILSNCR